MSSSVDNRVVSMEFENAKFEKNVSTSQKTLSKLKEMLNFKDAGKGFESIDKASGKVNFSAMEKALETVSSRFSNLGIIGMTVLQNLTNRAVDAGIKIGHALTSAITQGGKVRALNLEAAKFQIEGLGSSWEAVEKDISYGVKDTAYGLDAAAKVASQLLASQVTVGENMRNSLRSISGVAAMTNSTYEDIGQIYTTVAGNGRLMSEQLLQLSSRGLNAAAALGQQLGKSEKEIRDMVSKGQIDFQTFANAMDAAFGSHAKEANKTFTGALSNMKAALSRLGAAFYTPGLTYARDVINALTPVIDDAKAGLEPFFKLVEKGMQVISKFAVDALGKLDLKKTFNSFSLLASGMVPGFKNIGTAIADIFSSISSAFSTVFPPITNINGIIIKVGNSFTSFTRKLKPSEETLNKLSRVFQGLFSAVSLGIKIIKAVASIFGKLLSVLAPIGGVLLSVGAFLGDFITGLNNAANESKVFSKATEKIKEVLGSLANAFKTIYSTIREFFSNFLENASTILPKIVDKFKEIFRKIFDTVKNFISTVAGNFTFADLLAAISAGLIGGIAIKIKQFVDMIKGFLESLEKESEKESISDKIGKLFDNLSDTLTQFQQSIKVNMILKIAVALGILALSCKTLAEVDPARLASSLTAITVMFAELFAFMGAFTKVLSPKSFVNIDLVTSAMIKLSVAVLVLSFAVTKLAKLSWKELVKGLGSVAFLCLTLGKTMQKANFNNIKASSFIGLISLALAIRILASSVAKLGSLDMRSLIKGLGSMIVVLGALAGFLLAFNKIGKPKGMLSTATGLVLLATSMMIFAAAVEKLGSLSVNQLIKGLGSFVIVLGALTAAINLFPKSGRILSSATAMLEIAAAIGILAFAIEKLGNMSVKQLIKGLGSLAVVLALFAGTLIALTKLTSGPLGAKLIVVAAAIGVLSAAITLLVPALMTLGSMSLGSAITSLGMLAGIFVILGGAAYLLQPLIPALLGLSAAVALFGVGIAALGAGVLALSAGLAGLSGSVYVFVEAFSAIIQAILRLIPDAARALAEALIQFMQAILDAAPQIISSLTTLLNSILDSLTEVIPKLIALITTTLSEILASLTELLPQVIDLVVVTLESLMEAITELLPEFVTFGMNIILSLLQGITENMFEITAKAAEIIVNFINGLAEKLPEIIQAGFNLMISFLNGLADGIRNNMGIVMDAVWNVITAIIQSVLDTLMGAIGAMLSAGIEFIQGAIDGIGKGIEWAKNAVSDVVRGAVDKVGEFVGDMLNAGKNLIQGLIDGVGQMGQALWDSVTNLANGAVDTILGIFGIQSPSKVFRQIGVYTVEGFIIGIDRMSSKADRAMASMGTSAISSMRETLANVGRDISNGLSSDITITPVLDLSNVNKGVDSIYSAFDKKASISLDATSNRAISALRVNGTDSTVSNNSPNQVIYNNYDLTQNNYSPKALSRIDIYRDTKNQFSRLKGVAGK